MARPRWLLSCALPLMLSACWQTFTVEEEEDDGSGGTSTGGAAASGGSAGEGGLGGSVSSGGSAAGGTPPQPDLELAADTYEMAQGETLSVSAPGVLGNDEGDALRVVSFAPVTEGLPSGLEPLALDVAEDGTLSFEPSPEYWGTFELSYTVTDAHGAEASAAVSVHVAPRTISLGWLIEGFGGFVVEGATGDGLGGDLARAGDANDDGIDDFLVGAPDAASGDGRAFLVLGRTSPTTFQVDVATSRVVGLSGELGAVGCLGISADGLGDVNGDDVPDLVLGAPGCDSAPPGPGSVYVVHGGNTLSGTRDLTELGDDPTAQGGYRLTGQAQDRAGQVVLGGVDVDGDGVPDVVTSTREQIAAYNPFALVGVLSSSAQLGGDLRVARDIFITVGGPDATFPVDASRLGDVDDDFRQELLVGNRIEFAAVEAMGVPPEWPAEMDDVPTGFSFGASSLAGRIAGVGDFDGDDLPDLVACAGEPGLGETTQTCDLFVGSSLGDSVVAARWTIGNLPDADTPPDPAGGADLGGGPEDDFVIAHADGACLVWGRSAIPSADLDCAALPAGGGVEFLADPDFELTRAAVVGDVNGDGAPDVAFAAAAGGGGAGRVYVLFGGALD